MALCRWHCAFEIPVGHEMILLAGWWIISTFFSFGIFVSQRNGCLQMFYVDCVRMLVVTAESDEYCRCGVCEVAEESS